MAERKIFNHKSEILIDKTIQEEGYHPDKFGKTSGKFVWATCRFCGEPMQVRKGFFNKSGSACHKECRLEEQKRLSPFHNEQTKKKAYQKRHLDKTEEEKKIIGENISKSRKKTQYKLEQTNLERYGCKNVFESKIIQEKIRQTNLKNFGVEHPAKSEEVKNKKKKTNQERYGVDNPWQLDEIREKIKQTNRKKYDVDHPMQNQSVLQKSQETNQSRYGVKVPSQHPDIQFKIQNTNLEKYGSVSPLGNSKIQEKAKQTFIKKIWS